MRRKLLAEALGTAILVATVVGSGIMGETLAGGNIAVALMVNTAATVAILYVLITILGPISGAHFNPAVSFVARLNGELSSAGALAYVGAQVAGGISGTLLAHAMFDQPLLQVSAHVRAGPPQFLSEIVATFGLLLAILLGVRFAKDRVPALVAGWIGAGYFFTASTSFANPAVTIARTLTNTFSGIRPADAPAFIAAQLVGALLAALTVKVLLPSTSRP